MRRGPLTATTGQPGPPDSRRPTITGFLAGPAAPYPRPRRTVSAATPVAFATTATPPGPDSAASAPSHNCRWNSLRCGRSTAYRRATDSTSSATAHP